MSCSDDRRSGQLREGGEVGEQDPRELDAARADERDTCHARYCSTWASNAQERAFGWDPVTSPYLHRQVQRNSIEKLGADGTSIGPQPEVSRMPGHGPAIAADRIGEHAPRNRPKFEREAGVTPRSGGLPLRRPCGGDASSPALGIPACRSRSLEPRRAHPRHSPDFVDAESSRASLHLAHAIRTAYD